MNKGLTPSPWSKEFLLSQADKYQQIAEWHRISGNDSNAEKSLQLVATYQRLAKQHS
ncbi:hypothetical protein [Shewanella gelidii]|nr:hypothetical protein [Shewanella gelidii]MCL1098062.1 hypothetical protein [Shewanella gelidii]